MTTKLFAFSMLFLNMAHCSSVRLVGLPLGAFRNVPLAIASALILYISSRTSGAMVRKRTPLFVVCSFVWLLLFYYLVCFLTRSEQQVQLDFLDSWFVCHISLKLGFVYLLLLTSLRTIPLVRQLVHSLGLRSRIFC